MNKFAPKSVFFKKRALSLFKSGIPCREISRMLQIKGTDTVRVWVVNEQKRKHIGQAIDRAEKITALRAFGSVPITLAYVPGIVASGRYVMRAP